MLIKVKPGRRKNCFTFSFDIETTGLSPYAGAEVFAYAICDLNGNITVERRKTPSVKPINIRGMKSFLENSSTTKICHNLKFELSFMRMTGIKMLGTLHDTMIMSQLLNNIRYSHALDNLCADLCEYPTDIDKEVSDYGKQLGCYEKIPTYLFKEYQKRDVERTMILYKTFWPEIEGTPLEKDYWNEIELIKCTQRYEQRGILLSIPNCEELISKLDDDIIRVENEVMRITGEAFNLSSVVETGELLYDHFKFPVPPITKKGKKTTMRPTDKEAMQWLRQQVEHPILDLVLQYRSATHGISIIKGYLDCAIGGVIHPNIKTNSAQTGRQASNSPNLQNVQKEESQTNPYAVPARKCFKPRDGFVFLLPDYSGIEMRLIINATQEPELVELIRNNGDPHKLAAEILYRNFFDGSKKMRSAAKNAQFARAYGAGLGRVAATLGLSIADAKPGYTNYNERFPRIAGFTPAIAKQIKECGHVTTPFGRKLQINPMKGYSGSNYLIQGTAAGILKRAQVRVFKYIKENYRDKIFTLLPIHDELMFEVKKSLLPSIDKFVSDVTRIMVDMPEITVPLDVEWKIAIDSWNDSMKLTDYTIPRLSPKNGVK